MGQYHKVVNLDKKEVLNPHRMGVGIKLLEFSESRVTTALCALLAVSNGRGGGDLGNPNDSSIVGSWAGDRIAIIGDYWDQEEADETGIPTWADMDDEDEDGNPKSEASGYTDISLDILLVMCQGDSWLRQELLESVARYDWGKDWSAFFSDEEIAAERAKKEEN